MNDKVCPVTVLTGFLGAGKTSLLNALIRSDQSRRIAVIVNEFGALGIDAALIRSSEEDVIQLSNGCLCCNVRSDLIEACERLAQRRDEFDWLVIETSGLADPAPVAQSFLLGDGPSEHFFLDAVICLADALNVEGLLAREPMALRQMALADRIILSKCDLISASKKTELVRHLETVASQAEVMTSRADDPLCHGLTGLNAWAIGSLPPRLRFTPAPAHDVSITSLSFSYDQPFDFTAFSRLIARIMQLGGDDLLRIKGVLWLQGEDRRFAFHGVQGIADGDVIGPWESGPRRSDLVFIGRDLHRLQIEGGLRACLA